MVDPGLAGHSQIGNLITSNFFVTLLVGWLAGTVVLGLVAYFLKIRARITFSYLDRPSEQTPEGLSGSYAIRVPGMQWQGHWPQPDPAPSANPRPATQAGASQAGSTQAGFLRMPSRFDLRSWAKGKAQRAVFMLLTDHRVWLGLLRAPTGLLLRTLKTLRPQLVYCEVAHPQPETLGKMAAWHASIGYALGYPQPVHFDFSDRALRIQAEVHSEVRLLHLFTWVLRSSSDLPWWPMLRALWRGAFSKTLPGWREKGLRLILAIFQHLGKPKG
jgi:hypothetical protein